METHPGKVLIVDDTSFTRICSAILEADGLHAEALPAANDEQRAVDFRGISLIITSYPYCRSLLESTTAMSIPVIVLTDYLSSELLGILEGVERSFCMVKPLDYPKFKDLVRGLVKGQITHQGGFSLV